ncbi:hypothetical protein V8E52_011237 [Russula decolorans]|jgi:hypothetical protein
MAAHSARSSPPNSNDQPVDGQCDVLAFHSRHDLTLVRFPLVDIARIMDEWIAVYKRRGTRGSERLSNMCKSLRFPPFSI